MNITKAVLLPVRLSVTDGRGAEYTVKEEYCHE